MPEIPTITKDVLERVSDSEVQSKQTQEELDQKQHNKTEKSLNMMLSQMNAMNQVLDEVHDRIKNNSKNTIDFLDKINTGNERSKMPVIQNLEDCMH
jgi:hypothetical protein